MVTFYDKAIVDSLRSLTNDKVFIVPPENEFSIIGFLSDDKIKLPLVSLRRVGWNLTENRPHSMMFEGDVFKKDEITNKYISLQAFPIIINYMLDVWTEKQQDNDEIMRELIWYYTLNCKLKVDIPYKANIQHNFNLYFNNEIEDNSDIINFENRGRLYRQTASITIPDAYMWRGSSRYKTVVQADTSIIGEKDSYDMLKE